MRAAPGETILWKTKTLLDRSKVFHKRKQILEGYLVSLAVIRGSALVMQAENQTVGLFYASMRPFKNIWRRRCGPPAGEDAQ
jgi:hypothetical protein